MEYSEYQAWVKSQIEKPEYVWLQHNKSAVMGALCETRGFQTDVAALVPDRFGESRHCVRTLLQVMRDVVEAVNDTDADQLHPLEMLRVIREYNFGHRMCRDFLKRKENRAVLMSMARKIGISSPSALTNTDLVAAILDAEGCPVET